MSRIATPPSTKNSHSSNCRRYRKFVSIPHTADSASACPSRATAAARSSACTITLQSSGS